MSMSTTGMSEPFRLATAQEEAYFARRLYPLQDRVLDVASCYGESLVLTGGTALARCYFAHRYSDDIDLFTSEPKAGRLGQGFANALTKAGFSVEPVTVGPEFFRAIVSDGETSVQVDVAPDSPRVTPPLSSSLKVFVHDLRDIAGNKIGAYEDRTEVKDAVDLYYISKQIPWSQMFADAEKKRVPIAYEDLQHFLETPLRGQALLTKSIQLSDFETFVRSLRNEVALEIKKKR